MATSRSGHKPSEPRPDEPAPPASEPFSAEGRKSIVVLPFDNMSPDPADAYFSDGLTEEITTQLCHVHSLRVISRNSAMVFKDTQKDTRSIGQELGVQYVMEGSVRKAGDSLRITAQLIDATSDEHLWAETFSRELKDVFELQAEIALAVADALKASLDPGGLDRIRSHPTDNLDAHDAYLLGRQHWWRWTPEAMEKAKRYFERAVELDPSYAAARAALAHTFLAAGGSDIGILPLDEAIARAKAEAERAISTDPMIGEAYGVLGLVECFYNWKWKEAEQAVRRGIEVDPNSYVAWGHFAHVMGALGRREESLQATERFLELDPLQAIGLNNASFHYCHARRMDRARELAERCVQLDASSWVGTTALAYVDLCTGQYDQALARFDRGRNQWVPFYFSLVAYALARGGRTAEFEDMVERLKERAARGEGTWTEVAIAYMGADDRERALDHLELAPDQRPPPNVWTAWVGVLPLLDPIRDDHRFGHVLRRMGLSDEENLVSV